RRSDGALSVRRAGGATSISALKTLPDPRPGPAQQFTFRRKFMSASREHTRSIWMDVDVFPRAPLLDRDLTADTVVVGSGIAGLSTAYELSLLGQKVVVLDRGPIGGGITARTTAHLT